MTKVFGPFNLSEWETLLMLRKSIAYEIENNIEGECVTRDQKDYYSLINKAA